MEQDRRLVTIVLVVGAVAAFVSMFFGIKAHAARTGIEGVVLPLAGAAAVAIIVAAVWHLGFHTVWSLRTPGWKVVGLCGLGTVGVLALCAQTYLMATAFSGRAAVRHNLAEHEESARKSLRTAYENCLVELLIAPSVAATAAELQQMGAQELANGTFSGQRGPGPAVATFVRAAETFHRVAGEAKDAKSRCDALHAGGTDILSDMQAVAASNHSFDDMHKKFAHGLTQVEQLVLELQSIGVLQSVRTMQVSGMAVAGNGGSASAVKGVYVAVEQRLQKLQAEADKLQRRRKPVERTAFRPLDPGQAIVEYFSQVTAGWLFAVVIDLLPLMAILWMCIRTWSTPNEDRGPPPAPAE